MQKTLFILLTVFCSISLHAENAAINYFSGNIAEAMEQAKAQDKLIFVEGYATWCGPCKIMDKQVFTNKQVGTFYNENFINVKLDIDSKEGLAFREKYPLEGIPFYGYIDKDGDLIHQDLGIIDAPELIKIGEVALQYVNDMVLTDKEIGSLAPKMAEQLCKNFGPLIELNEELEIAKELGNARKQRRLLRKIEPRVKKFETFWTTFEAENRGRMKNDFYASAIRMEVRMMNPKVYDIMYGK